MATVGNMDKWKQERASLRRAFTRKSKDLEKMLENDDEETDVNAVLVLADMLTGRVQQMFSLDDLIFSALVENSTDSDIIDRESDSTDDYRLKWMTLKRKVDQLAGSTFNTQKDDARSEDRYSYSFKTVPVCDSDANVAEKRHFRLPKLELKKFDGAVKNWIGFWGQFRKIHEDIHIDNYDKFQYLIQAMEEGTSAKHLVESFPPSSENYEKAIRQLKDRFARDNLLVEVYVRELLSLVLSQAKKNHQLSLTALYDNLTTQLRALESLGVTSDKYAAMLLLLVESALPEDILKAYERYRIVDSVPPDDDTGKQLSKLLIFLQREVESNQRITMAKMTIGTDECSSNRHPQDPSASCLVAVDGKTAANRACIFCDKQTHCSSECLKLPKLTLEERNTIIRDKKGCSYCLRTGHRAKTCRMFIKCLVCSKRHNTVMCPELNKGGKKDSGQRSTELSSSQIQVNTITMLQTMVVNIVHNNKRIPVRAFIDSGAQRSYVRKDLVQKLQLQSVGQISLNHCVFGGQVRKSTIHNVFKITIENPDRSFQMTLTALDEAKLCGTLPYISQDLNAELRRFNIKVTDTGDISEVGILIGADAASYFMTGTIVHIHEGLIAVNTKLGWTVQGQAAPSDCDEAACCLTNTLFCQNDLDLQDLWNLETIGITDRPDKQEQEVIENFKNTIYVNGEGRYEVPLPWKYDNIPISTNRMLAEKRLNSTSKRLNLTDNFDAYDDVFKEWLKLGIIEEVESDNGKGHYLPHHAVIKESNLTTRTRPVFDASANDERGRSLNSCLEKGINLIELIPVLLTQVRKHAIGVTSDICKAFLQISITPSDRHYLKFLWWKDKRQQEIITFQHCRVVFGLTCSPFLLAATLKYHLENYKGQKNLEETAQKLLRSFYVDNCVTSFETVKEVSTFMTEAKKIMMDGMFDLRCWISAPVKSKPDVGIVSVLGVRWNTKCDSLCCDIGNMDISSKKITKRMLLSIAQRVFDPIGFTAPTTLIPKLILQRAWLTNVNWDDKLPQDIENDFKAWLLEIDVLKECEIPRRLCTAPIKDCNRSLHTFCDASNLAYATCIFLRTEFQNTITVRLVSAKVRVAPTKKAVTIPRLELLAALIGARLCDQVKRSLKIECEMYYWTDSTVALTWIKKESQWDVFVRNRVNEIRRYSEVSAWRHIPGSINPADLVCRGCSPEKLMKSAWWLGPSWLSDSKETWPDTDIVFSSEVVSDQNMTEINIDLTEEKFTDILQNISSYTKIIKVVAYCLRWRYKQNKAIITMEEYSRAEIRLFRLVLHEIFSKKPLSSKNIKTFTDKNDLLRVETKLILHDSDLNFKIPILLPGTHFVIERLVRREHTLLLHAGVQIIIANLRKRFWIVGVRRLARKIISRCVICKRHNSKPADVPFAPLPFDRTNLNAAVFQICGIDLAGPLYLKSNVKAYIVLFTCAVFRAVHLEVVDSLSTDAFLMALRRFIARRGCVEIIYSDNGSNFQGANNLFKMLDWTRIESESLTKRLKWKFIPPTAAWWGGWWERLIKIIKDLLKRVLGKASLTYIELETILFECEAVTNSRPLTYISEDDELVALSPASFLQSIPTAHSLDSPLDAIDRVSLCQRIKYLQKLRTDLKQRFQKEYLALLVHRGQRPGNTVKVGDVVLVEKDSKRIFWPLAKVVELIPGVDGVSRVAKLKTKSGILTRPLQRVYPLEV